MTARLYVFAGAPKCGSTWLYDQFRRHPQVTVGRIKDPFYFDRHYGRGDDWYWSLFGVNGQVAPGGVYVDVSHDYLYEPLFPQRCTASAAGRGAEPYVHVVLRNPLERLLSAIHYQVSFEGDLRPGPVRSGYPKMVAESCYAAHVGRLLDSLPAERLRIDLFDDLAADSARLIGDVCSWLGVDRSGSWLDPTPSRSRRAPRRPALAFRARRVGVLLRRAGIVRLVDRAKTSAAIERLFFSSTDGRPDRNVDVDLGDVVAELSADVTTLSRLLGRDLNTLWELPA